MPLLELQYFFALHASSLFFNYPSMHSLHKKPLNYQTAVMLNAFKDLCVESFCKILNKEVQSYLKYMKPAKKNLHFWKNSSNAIEFLKVTVNHY